MKLHFAGAPEITAPRALVWTKLLDADFVAASAPGVESVERVDPTHFQVISGLGVGVVKVRFKLDVELFDIVEGERLKMRARGKAPGSNVDVVSALQVEDAGNGHTRLNWSATSDVSGTVASIGARSRAKVTPVQSTHQPSQERPMSDQKHIRLELTEEQKAQIKAATGKDARTLELNTEELEDRIAPLTPKLRP